jgi:hypothetical protein
LRNKDEAAERVLRRKRVVIRFATSADTPKSLANAGTAALGVEEAKVHVMVARDATPVRVHLYAYLDGHAINNHKT